MLQQLLPTAMRTRIAPTPSGYLHVGNAASFLLTARLAQQHGGSLLLRIDDLDKERVRPAYIQDIFDTLAFLNIHYEQGPQDAVDFANYYSQHLRLSLYEELLTQLCATGLVYACVCSRRQMAAGAPCVCQTKALPLDMPDVAWRVQVPTGTIIRFKDEKRGELEIDLAAVMPHFIIRKRDGLPAYQVASLADDLHFSINYLVRGEDLLPSTAAQLYLARLAVKNTFLQARFYHHPLLLGANGLKLSKSAGDISVKALRQDGFTIHELQKWLSGW
jgi:glutamyl/glutaminyl-tRNA synthetase